MSAAEQWVVPAGCRKLDDLMQEYGRDHAQTKLMSGEWPAFELDLNTGDLAPIPATTWCVARGRTWLDEGGRRSICILSFGPGTEVLIPDDVAVIVRVPEQLREKRKKREAPQVERAKLAIAKLYPNPGGTDGVPTKAVYRAVADELKADSEKRGLAIPSEPSVKRALGRRE